MRSFFVFWGFMKFSKENYMLCMIATHFARSICEFVFLSSGNLFCLYLSKTLNNSPDQHCPRPLCFGASGQEALPLEKMGLGCPWAGQSIDHLHGQAPALLRFKETMVRKEATEECLEPSIITAPKGKAVVPWNSCGIAPC
jgi:hypothetical protein